MKNLFLTVNLESTNINVRPHFFMDRNSAKWFLGFWISGKIKAKVKAKILNKFWFKIQVYKKDQIKGIQNKS
jgi:hypothetical protein